MKALITGINGQDGSYLAEYLLAKGYEVHGTKRRSSITTTMRLNSMLESRTGTDLDFKVKLHHADLTDSSSLNRIINEVEPDEIYNLAAQSHVAVSFEEPEYTANTDALGCLRLLEAIRAKNPKIKFYQASTSELFGGLTKGYLDETSVISPRSPYAAAKAYAFYVTKQYREAYGLFAINGILFNHESPRRGANFVSQKIISGIKGILAGKLETLKLGNLNAERDWGHARDYVRAMWMMMNHRHPDDFVIATGITVSVREFCVKAFRAAGIHLEFTGKGLDEIGVVASLDGSQKNVIIGQKLIEVDNRFFRPLEVDYLRGNSQKARDVLGWMPKISLDELINEMILNDHIF